MNHLTVTVVIPSYNRAHLIGRALRSALSAILPGDEILVVDDGSEDNTEEVVKSFGGPVRFIRASHAGAGAARNLGVREAKCDLIAFLDSDDEWFPDRLILQRRFLEARPDVLFCCTNFQVKLETGEVYYNYLKHWHKDDRSWDEILAPGMWFSSIAPLPEGRADFRVHVGDLFLAEMESNYVATSTVIVRRVEAGEALHFADDLQASEDKECFARLAQAGLVAYFDCETSVQWGHSGPRITDATSYDLASSRIVLLDRIWGHNQNFMAQYGNRVEREKQKAYLKRIQWLLVRGRNNEARADLRQVQRAPFSFRVLAAMPPSLTRSVLALRRLITNRP